jgi:RimJ/RimL family protein N-acetyltransferase
MLPVPGEPLTDGVILLRPPDERDLPAIEAGIRDPGVVEAFGRATTSAESLLDLNRRRWAEGSGATFSICEGDGPCLGHVFVNMAAADRGTVGYWLLPEGRGKGLATRAVRLVSSWAFSELGLARVGLLTEPSNLASQRVAERSGFRREGVLRSFAEIDGRRVNYVSFSLLPSDL